MHHQINFFIIFLFAVLIIFVTINDIFVEAYESDATIFAYPEMIGDINVTMYYDEDFTEKLELEDEKLHEEESKEWNKK